MKTLNPKKDTIYRLVGVKTNPEEVIGISSGTFSDIQGALRKKKIYGDTRHVLSTFGIVMN